jgi:hypothetical protein
VKNADLAQDGFAALIDEAKIDILKIPDLTRKGRHAGIRDRLLTRLSAASRASRSGGCWRSTADEEWQQRQITWAGMPEMMVAFLNAVAGAADIPMTRLLGMSPKGLQSNGDGEERDYQSMVRARQNELLCAGARPDRRAADPVRARFEAERRLLRVRAAQPDGREGRGIDKLDQVMTIARDQRLSSVALVVVHPDGTPQFFWSDAPSKGLLIGSVARLQAAIIRSVDDE